MPKKLNGIDWQFCKRSQAAFTKLASQGRCSNIDAKRNTSRFGRVPEVLFEIQNVEQFASLALTRALAGVKHIQLAYVTNVISFWRDTGFCRSHQ